MTIPICSQTAHAVDQLDDEEPALPEAGATAEADEELELDASASFFLFRMAFRIAAD